MTQIGTPMGAAYFKALYEDVKARADRGEGVIPEDTHVSVQRFVVRPVKFSLGRHHGEIGYFTGAEADDGVLDGGNLAQPRIERGIGNAENFADQCLVRIDQLNYLIQGEIAFRQHLLQLQGNGVEYSDLLLFIIVLPTVV